LFVLRGDPSTIRICYSCCCWLAVVLRVRQRGVGCCAVRVCVGGGVSESEPNTTRAPRVVFYSE